MSQSKISCLRSSRETLEQQQKIWNMKNVLDSIHSQDIVTKQLGPAGQLDTRGSLDVIIGVQKLNFLKLST